MLDERFLMHRLKSTSLAAVVGGVTLGVWFMYQHVWKGLFRWDLLTVLIVMAVTKLAAMIYYRFFD